MHPFLSHELALQRMADRQGEARRARLALTARDRRARRPLRRGLGVALVRAGLRLAGPGEPEAVARLR